MNKPLKDWVPSPDARYSRSDMKDENYYNKIAARLDKMGRLIYLDDYKSDSLHSCKKRLYFLPKGAVKLSQGINTSLNQYLIDVQVEVFSNTKRTAEKLLEDIIR